MNKLPNSLYADNWKIIAGVPSPAENEYVLTGYDPKSPTPYGTWTCFINEETQEYDTVWGHYFEDKDSAIKDMLERAKWTFLKI